MRLYFQWWDTYWNWKTCWNQRKIVLVSLQIPPSLPEVSVRRWVSDLPLSSQRSWSFRWPSRRSWYSLRGIYWKPDMLDGWYAMTHMPWSSTHPLFCNSWQSGQVRTSSLLRDFNSEVFLVFFSGCCTFFTLWFIGFNHGTAICFFVWGSLSKSATKVT